MELAEDRSRHHLSPHASCFLPQDLKCTLEAGTEFQRFVVRLTSGRAVLCWKARSRKHVACNRLVTDVWYEAVGNRLLLHESCTRSPRERLDDNLSNYNFL